MFRVNRRFREYSTDSLVSTMFWQQREKEKKKKGGRERSRKSSRSKERKREMTPSAKC